MGRSRGTSIGTLAGISMLAALGLGACQLDLGDAPFKCRASGTRCPPDYICKETYCVRPGACPPVLKACRDGGASDARLVVLDQGEAGVRPDMDLAKCGNSVCDPGETHANCPLDCPASTCGNSVCDSGETYATCPQDCPAPCTKGQTKCGGPSTLVYCDNGTWKSSTCQSICTLLGYGYSSGCKANPQKGGKEVCFCGGGYGDHCAAAQPCGSGLACIQFMSGSFCTQTCPNNLQECTSGKPAPKGTKAFCVLPYNGKNYCAFLCKTSSGSWSCPSGLTCASRDNPPGSGQYVCEP